jgi:hypothetical protein
LIPPYEAKIEVPPPQEESEQDTHSWFPPPLSVVGVSNNIMEHEWTKVCLVNWDDWDEIILIVLWAYKNKCETLTNLTMFQYFYGIEVIMLLEYLTPNL